MFSSLCLSNGVVIKIEFGGHFLKYFLSPSVIFFLILYYSYTVYLDYVSIFNLFKAYKCIQHIKLCEAPITFKKRLAAAFYVLNL